LITVLACLPLAACRGTVEDHPQTTFHPVSEYGRSLNGVFLNTFVWTMIILVLVLALMLYVVIRFRERPGQPEPKHIHGNTKLELLWTIVPAVIVMFIAIPTVQTIFTTQRRPAADALTVEVVGHQWWWEFRYPELGVVTANQFHLPVGREVHLRMHSADVIHSFWLPRIGGKRDLMPRPRTTEGERPRASHIIFTIDSAGTYRGQCAEFCGASHAIMEVSVVAESPAEFDAWVESIRDTATPVAPTPAAAPADSTAVRDSAAAAAAVAAAAPASGPAVQDTAQAMPASMAAAQTPASALEEEGKRVFLSRTCVVCHAVSNTTAKGQVGPNLTRFGSRPTVGAGARPNTPENVEAWIDDPRSLKAGALMPGAREAAAGFPATGLTDEEIRAVAAYLSSLE
jgi:cytochrome c oxidase subunit 2